MNYILYKYYHFIKYEVVILLEQLDVANGIFFYNYTNPRVDDNVSCDC